MNGHLQSEELFIRAAKAGLDGPTEGQVGDAINDAVENHQTEMASLLLSGGFKKAAEYIERIHDRKHGNKKEL